MSKLISGTSNKVLINHPNLVINKVKADTPLLISALPDTLNETPFVPHDEIPLTAFASEKPHSLKGSNKKQYQVGNLNNERAYSPQPRSLFPAKNCSLKTKLCTSEELEKPKQQSNKTRYSDGKNTENVPDISSHNCKFASIKKLSKSISAICSSEKELINKTSSSNSINFIQRSSSDKSLSSKSLPVFNSGKNGADFLISRNNSNASDPEKVLHLGIKGVPAIRSADADTLPISTLDVSPKGVSLKNLFHRSISKVSLFNSRSNSKQSSNSNLNMLPTNYLTDNTGSETNHVLNNAITNVDSINDNNTYPQPKKLNQKKWYEKIHNAFKPSGKTSITQAVFIY